MKRDSVLDVYRGMCMILVILGHSIGYITDPVNHFIVSFHMPTFFFVSGLCIHLSTNERGIKDNILHKLKTLGWQYLVFSLLGIILYLLVFSRISNSENISSTEAILRIFTGQGITKGCWFVYDLLLISVFYILFQNDKYRPYTLFAVLIALYGIVQPLWSTFEISPVVPRIIAGGVFYVAGDIYGRLFYKRTLTFCSEHKNRGLIYSMLLWVAVALTALSNTPVLMHTADFGNIYTFIVGAFIAALAATMLAAVIKANKFTEYIGKNSILFLFFHFYALDFSHMMFNKLFVSGLNNSFPYYLIHFVVALTLCFILSYLTDRFFPFLGNCDKLIFYRKRKLSNK